ncbi:hypothetical protein QK887_26150, partial [Salmonella enterica subsp. enterica serovar Oslo]
IYILSNKRNQIKPRRELRGFSRLFKAEKIPNPVLVCPPAEYNVRASRYKLWYPCSRREVEVDEYSN